MTRHHTLMIVLTFLMGFLTGIFGYFWSQNSGEGKSPVSPLDEFEGYELLLTAYGGCERVGCPSFRLLSDGSYQYLAPQGVRDYARFEDTISKRQRETITDLVAFTDFDEVAASTFEGTCPVTYDGLAYRLDVRTEEGRYSFDSCIESLDTRPLVVELVRYFDIMEATHGNAP